MPAAVIPGLSNVEVLSLIAVHFIPFYLANPSYIRRDFNSRNEIGSWISSNTEHEFSANDRWLINWLREDVFPHMQFKKYTGSSDCNALLCNEFSKKRLSKGRTLWRIWN
jgi:hypothetical protein